MPRTINENRLAITFIIAKFQNAGFKEKNSYKRETGYYKGSRITVVLDFSSNTGGEMEEEQ